MEALKCIKKLLEALNVDRVHYCISTTGPLAGVFSNLLVINGWDRGRDV